MFSFKRLIIVFCSLYSVFAVSEQFNIYVKYDDSALKSAIYDFNHAEAVQDILVKYNIKPFIDAYPLHNTLYLAEFESYSIPAVIDTLNIMVKKLSKFEVKTGNIIVSQSGYVMWNLLDETKFGDQNPVLQQYSDKVVMALYRTRDTFASPPIWVLTNPEKLKAFQRYGSPNVFFEFSPHFTLMAKQFVNERTQQAFVEDMQTAIHQYFAQHPAIPITLKANAIAIGYVNDFGQVTREIVSFKLS